MQVFIDSFSQATSLWNGLILGNQSGTATIASLGISSFGTLGTAGISNPVFQHSNGGKAVCVSGIVNVPLSASAINITYPGPKDNFELTELITDIFRVNTDAWTRYFGGETTISGTFEIYSKLCIPRSGENTTFSTVQFLSHGGTLDNSYWDFSRGYSYVDTAAENGYATFSYDRLGSGKSQHPDPLQIVQAPFQVNIAHELIKKLRAGEVGGIHFKNVIGIGHSLGGAITQSLSRLPDVVDAIILTGHSGFRGGMSTGFASAAWQIANTLPDRPFTTLPNGYIAHPPVPQTMQFSFFYHPHFDPAIFQQEFQTRGTSTISEILTLADLYGPVPTFTKPVMVLNGKQDYFFCQGDCDAEDITIQTLETFYPNAAISSEAVTLPNIGHNINFHLEREKAFIVMLGFIKKLEN